MLSSSPTGRGARRWTCWVRAGGVGSFAVLAGCTPALTADADVDAAVRPAGATISAQTLLRYDRAARTLTHRAELEMVQRGAGQYAEAVLDASVVLTIVPQRERLHVVWEVADVARLELGGALHAPGDEPKTFLLQHGRGAYLSDLRGLAEVDPELRTNVEREAALTPFWAELRRAADAGEAAQVMPGLQILSYLPPLVQLPSLPERPLRMGEPVEVQREEQTELGETGVLLPFDVEMTYTLVNIDGAGADRLAEMTFKGSAAGSHTLREDEQVLIESRQRGSLLFNLDAHVPVAYEATRVETYEMEEFSGETETTIRASWD